MNETDRNLASALFSDAVADQETVRSRVLAAAHEPAAQNTARPAPRRHRWVRFAALPVAACLAFFVLLNVSAPFAHAVSAVPVLGDVARLITFREWESSNESSDIHGQQPAVEGTGSETFEQTVNALIDDKMSALDEKAQTDAAEYRKNWLDMGNKSEDFVPIRYTFDYETYYTSHTAVSFLIREQKTVTTNTEDTYTALYYYNLDIASGADLTLAGLLGEDWKTIVADAVDAQIRASGDARKLAYYEEFWVSKNVPIDESIQFYLTSEGKIAVVFDEGWIAPFEDGPQTFVLPDTLPLD